MDDGESFNLVPNSWCNFTCPGNPNQLCGGNGTLASLYDVGKNSMWHPIYAYVNNNAFFWSTVEAT